jgi:hypothetical protein
LVLPRLREALPRFQKELPRILRACHSTVVVETTTSLAAPAWSPVSTNLITYAPGSANPTNGWMHFTDPQWANQPARFYRPRTP